MGMFDTIVFDCPRCRTGRVEAQSKGGDCNMQEYTNFAVPIKVAGDAVGDDVGCTECKARFRVGAPPTVMMYLVPL